MYRLCLAYKIILNHLLTSYSIFSFFQSFYIFMSFAFVVNIYYYWLDHDHDNGPID